MSDKLDTVLKISFIIVCIIVIAYILAFISGPPELPKGFDK